MDGKYVDGNLIISHLMPPMPFKRGPVRSLLSAVNNNTVSSLNFNLFSLTQMLGKCETTYSGITTRNTMVNNV